MRLGNQRGFSLVELLVASAIFFMFMVAVAVAYVRSHEIYRRGLTRIEVQQGGRIGLDTMVREMRMAGNDPSDIIAAQTPTSAFQNAEDNTVTFLGDVDGDAVTDRVTYRRVGRRIIREASAWDGDEFPEPDASEIVVGVTDLSFSYFDGSATVSTPVDTGDLEKIRRIQIGLDTSAEAVGTRSSFPLSMDVTPRNL